MDIPFDASLDHRQTGQEGSGDGGVKTMEVIPVVDVVVFPTPAPVVVGEPIDFQELLFAHRRHAPEVLIVW